MSGLQNAWEHFVAPTHLNLYLSSLSKKSPFPKSINFSATCHFSSEFSSYVEEENDDGDHGDDDDDHDDRDHGVDEGGNNDDKALLLVAKYLLHNCSWQSSKEKDFFLQIWGGTVKS